MIKNRKDLLRGISKDAAQRRRVLCDIVDYVLKETSSVALVRGKISAREVKRFEKVAVFALGKAGRSMAQAVLPALGRKPDYLVVADTGHPLPTARGQLLTRRMEKIAHTLGERDLAIVLISGGGSAMCVDPVEGITLEEKITTTQALLKSGATINEVNTVRKHLSRVKGGRLAEMLYPAQVWGLVISDVVGNDLSTIASGPLSPDPTSFADALAIIKKYAVKLPPAVKKYLLAGAADPRLETPKSREKYFKNVRLEIIADHSLTARKALEKAQKMGLKAYLYDTPIQGEARGAAARFLQTSLKKSYDLYIATGETTVTCRGDGFGGRNQEFVLASLPYLKPRQTLLSLGTDGIDGICPEKIAGAIGDSETMEIAKRRRLSMSQFLKNNDSYTFFKKTGGLLKTGATGTNLGDLMLFL